MTTLISPTVLDVSRAIAYLDENPEVRNTKLVIENLAYQFAKHNGWGGRRNVTTRDVRAALIAHGASTLTVEKFARVIASRIRSDFSDGRNRNEES